MIFVLYFILPTLVLKSVFLPCIFLLSVTYYKTPLYIGKPLFQIVILLNIYGSHNMYLASLHMLYTNNYSKIVYLFSK